MKVTGIGNIFQQKRNKKKESISFGTILEGFPTAVEIGISRNCNLRCSYCPNSSLKEKRPDIVMPMALFIKILKNLKAIGFKGFIHYHRFNEPSLVHVEDYIRETKKILPNAITELFTNGTLLDMERLKSLRKTPLDKIIVTQHQGVKKGFINRLDEIPDELLKNVVTKYGDEIDKVNRDGVLGHLEEPFSEPCYSIHTTLAIDSDGRVPLCTDDSQPRVILGDLKTETLEEIWNKPFSRDLREKLDKGDRKSIIICRDCDRTTENRILSADLSKNSALYRKELLLKTGSAHIK